MRATVRRRAAGRVARGAFIAIAMALTGCADLSTRDTAPVADRSAIAARFDIEGRLSARRGSDGGAANFTWHHDGARDEVDLATPLGQTLARLAGDAQGVRAQWPDGRSIEARDWDALTQRTLGVGVPVLGLAAWLRGLAHPGSAATMERDARGRAAVLRQDGWEIVYAYPDDASARANRLTLRYAQGEPAEVRIVIDRWE
jgi:outer membrane lipoprotein LolB